MASTPETFRYDAFLSYRHQEPDRSFAWNLVDRLESAFQPWVGLPRDRALASDQDQPFCGISYYIAK